MTLRHKLKSVVLLCACIFGAGAGKSPLCTRDNALDIIKQQVDLTRTFNDSGRRIAVLIRAADLLWPHEQKRARAVFTEAFELAIENEKEDKQQ